MREYHKIQTVYKRNPAKNNKTLLEGQCSIPEFEYLWYNNWIFTEKVDGTNVRIMYQDGKISIAGKTDDSQMLMTLSGMLNDDFVYSDFANKGFSKIFDDPDAKVCLYCEGYGAKVQKGGGNYRSDPGVVLFDVLIDDWWLKREDVEDVAQKLFMDVVPVIGNGSLDEMCDMARKGFDSIWGDFQAEGIVARPKVELKARNGDRIITKIKCKDFRNEDMANN